MRDALHVPTRTLFLTACLTLGGVATAPTVVAQDLQQNTADRPAPPYEAVIDVPEAEVRSGAGRAYYPIAVLPEGTRITVQEEYLNWYRVDVPDAASAYVLAKDVEFNGRGGSGPARVSVDQAYAFHAGLDRGANTSFKRARVLRRGDTVQVIEVVDDEYLRIEPPAQTRAFLAPGTLRPAPAPTASTPEPPARTATTPTASGNEAGASAAATKRAADQTRPEGQIDRPTVEVVEVVDMVGVGEGEGELNGPENASMSVEVIDERVSDTGEAVADAPTPPPAPTVATADTPAGSASATPPDVFATPEPVTPQSVTPVNAAAADLDPALALEPISADSDAGLANGSGDTPESPALSDPLQAVERQMLPMFERPVDQQPLDQMAAAYNGLDADALPPFDQQLLEARLAAIARNRDLASALGTIQATQRDLPVLEPLELEADPGTAFEAVGVLRASRVFRGSGGGNTPLLFRVVDAGTNRTVAYLRPVEGVNAAGQLGALVGVRGTSAYDPSLRTTLITADAIVPLAPAAP